jgi:sec-independent protein translocase protein TatA
MMRLGPTELIIILIIVVLLFGAGRISKIAGEMGNAVKNFRENVKSDDDKEGNAEETDNKQ